MNRSAFTCTVILSCAGAIELAGPAVTDLKEVLPKKLERPYLHFTKGDLVSMRERVKTDRRAKEVYQRLLKEADRILDMHVSNEVPPRLSSGTPYFEGWRDPYELYFEELGRNCYQLAFIYQMTGDKKYARKSYEFAAALCELDSWVYSGDRFRVLYWMGKPYGAKWNENDDNETVYSYDLSAARITRQLAATYDWLYSTLDDYQRKKIRNALLENAILRVRGNYDYHWWAHAWRTNWLPVCFSGVGLAALALYPEDPQLLDVVSEARNRMSRFLEEAVGVDGGYQEGVTYWKYGIENLALFAAALKNASKGQVDLFQHPKLRLTLQFPVYTFAAPQGHVAFADSYEALQGNWDLYNKLAAELGSPEAKWLAEFFRPFNPAERLHSGTRTAVTPPMERVPWTELDPFTIIWPEAQVKPAPLPASLSKHFRTINWVVMRASWDDTNYPLVAAKGGIHDDPHHGHLDAGQFAIKYRGEWFVKELAYMQPSDFGYWHYQRRFKDYIYANSLGHNVIFVNGEQQEYGSQYSGKVVRFESSPGYDYTLIDATKAYLGKELKLWRRHIRFEKPQLVLILDEVKAAPGAVVRARIHPGVPFEIVKDKYLLLSGEQGKIAALPLASEALRIEEDRHPILARLRSGEFYWVPFYDLVIRASGNTTRILNVFAPVESEQEAEALGRSLTVATEGNRFQCKLIFKGKPVSSSFELAP